MSGRWETVAARAWGLATHLLDDDTLSRLERLGDRRALAGILSESRYGELLPGGADEEAVDVAVTRHAALQIATLERWARPHEDLLAPVLLHLDARAIRTLARGLRAGILPDERVSDAAAPVSDAVPIVSDAMPTSSLGRKELEMLGRTGSVREMTGLLAAWGHPLASPIREALGVTEPGLFDFEAALSRALGEAMTAAAADADHLVRSFVRQEIDSWNVATALVLSGGDPSRKEGSVDVRSGTGEESPESRVEVDDRLYVEGGSALSFDDFAAAATAEGPGACSEVLATALRGTMFAEALEGGPTSIAAIDDRILGARIRRLRAQGRLRPLSPAPVLSLILRLRREGRSLRGALWRTSVSAPRAA